MSATRPTGKSDARPDAAEGMGSGGAEAECARRNAELEAELAGVKDRLLRALAEQENSRRRAARERDEAVKFAESGLARDLLSTVDDLGRARNSVPEEKMADETVQKLLTGVAAIERGLLDALEKHGIRRIYPLGEPFDPNRHQAVFLATDNEHLAGTVIEVLQPGYLHHDRLLRPATVGVAKAGGGSAMAAGRGAAESAGGDEAV
jgi:molecular chaperone GrpE